MDHWYSKSKEEVLQSLEAKEKGLTKEESKERLKKHGLNQLSEKKSIPLPIVFLKQFNNYLIYILLIAAAISYFLGHLIDVYVVLAVVLVNASIGFIQEYKTENAIKALKRLVVSYAKVYRDNELTKIPASNLVPGDIVLLEEGDRVPSDCYVLELKNLRTNESSLTGESFPATKEIKIFPENTQLGDRKNMVFMGTFVSSGSCKAIVVDTGSKTIIGTLAKDIEKIEVVKSHFREKSDVLAKQLGLLAIFGALVTFIVGYFFRDFEFSEIFLFTIATLVSVIPEGLPAVLAIVLAIGAYRMSKKNALIRKLPATETLGIVTTIITDKTGTLTENTMNVDTVYIPGYHDINVTGNGWEPKGSFMQKDKEIIPLENEHLKKLLHISATCNNSKVLKEKDLKKGYSIIGDPTEASLVVLSAKAGIKDTNLKENRIDDLPFNSELKYRASLSTLVNHGKKKQVYVIGAPEAVLENSTYILRNNTKHSIKSEFRKEISSKVDELTGKGMRVLALAYADVKANTEKVSEEIVKDLVFVGIVGIRDPPRPEVKEAISKAKEAGIRVIMATGDHLGTALAIGKEIGLINKDERGITGQELEKLSKAEFIKTVKNISIFARLTPHMKLKIASELQAQGQIVAMTGDGVNDAPALKKADIGISMGIIGTDVARESSDIVLADDNFASIINAIEEGRVVFTNTRQASSYLLSTGIAELSILLIALIVKLPLPLIPIQILWINLITGGGSDISIATEKDNDNLLKTKPRNAKEQIISKEIAPLIMVVVATMVTISFFLFTYYLPDGIEKARTVAFVSLSFSELFNVYNMRSLKKSVFEIGVFSNKWVNIATVISTILLLGVLYIPFFQGIFQFATLKITELLIIFIITSSVLIIGETYKRIVN
jgi:P-type Ca2+ transporter type 2C